MAQSTNLDLLGAFSETFKVAIQPYGNGNQSTYYDFQGIIAQDSLEINEGDRGIESIPVGGGGRVVKMNPKEDSEVTFDLYPVDQDFKGGTGMSQAFRNIVTSWDATEPFDETDTRNRDTFFIAVLFTDDAANTGADEATAAGSNSLRWCAAHAFLTGYKKSFDGILKETVTFTIPATTKTGEHRIHECSGDSTALSAIQEFDSANFSPTVAAGTPFTWH